jgi:hypothetical protein
MPADIRVARRKFAGDDDVASATQPTTLPFAERSFDAVVVSSASCSVPKGQIVRRGRALVVAITSASGALTAINEVKNAPLGGGAFLCSLINRRFGATR